MRDIEVIDSELCLLAAFRRATLELSGRIPFTALIDELLDEARRWGDFDVGAQRVGRRSPGAELATSRYTGCPTPSPASAPSALSMLFAKFELCNSDPPPAYRYLPQLRGIGFPVCRMEHAGR